MLLGKRPRPPMRRTTSTANISFSDLLAAASDPASEVAPVSVARRAQKPRVPETESDGIEVETAYFLRACGLCRRRLGNGKDIFIYRGEMAFCSLECRQKQIAIDERKDKCSFVSMKINPPHPPARSKPTTECNTAAA